MIHVACRMPVCNMYNRDVRRALRVYPVSYRRALSRFPVRSAGCGVGREGAGDDRSASVEVAIQSGWAVRGVGRCQLNNGCFIAIRLLLLPS